uniref:chromatin accessibility complex protein 1-like n=1 Tax=Styela clava TaxID=7725 RepID=UPI00193AA820|nr:chromatin accessibility complex protein 1-like [Styela clava]
MSMTSPSKDLVRLPLSKIKTIMKSSPDVENIGIDAAFCMSKAAELFVTYLTAQAYYKEDNRKTLEYSHLANIVNSDDDDILGFLQEIIPQKITIREYREIIARAKNTEKGGDETQV